MRIEELKQKIEEQKEENVKLFKIFEYKMHKEEMQPIIQQWRKGSTKIKALLNELYQLEIKECNERKVNEDNKNESKTFVNGYGEATKREITCSTYTRTEKSNAKAMLSFIGG